MSRNGWRMARWCALVTAALVVGLVLAVAPAGAVGGVRYVDRFVTRNCQSKTPCYQNIQAAVNAAQPGDVIYVFPATYEAGVDLSNMSTEGNISLITVDADGNPTPGTVTVDNPGDAPEIYTGNPLTPFNGDVTIDGFVLRSEYGAIDLWVGSSTIAPQGVGEGLGPGLSLDVVIRNVDASETGEDGIKVRAEGNVTITDCTTNGNNGAGILVYDTWGDVTVTGCTANENTCLGPSGYGSCIPNGIAVQAGGQVKITDCTTNGNDEDGIFVGGLLDAELGAVLPIDGGDVTIKNCTSNGNGEAGFDAWGSKGTLSIQACIARDNEDGVHLMGALFGDAGLGIELDPTVLVNGSIICGNECGVNLSGGNNHSLGNGAGMNFEGNWWGCEGGPEVTGCDPICQLDSLPVDFTPWIERISASATVDPVMVGEPTLVSFQFAGGPASVYLGRGPGDLRGPAPFTVSTDNGRLDGNGSTLHKFINAADGTLKVTLVPEREGTATVTVTGPCGLSGLEGATAVLGVLQEEFVPEPATVLLLGSGLMGLAGYAGLLLRKQ